MARAMTTEQARATAAARRVGTNHCTVCGAGMIGTSRRRYCSAACRVREHYYRRRGGFSTAPEPRLNAVARDVRARIAALNREKHSGIWPLDAYRVTHAVRARLADGNWHFMGAVIARVRDCVPSEKAWRAARGGRGSDEERIRQGYNRIAEQVVEALGCERRGEGLYGTEVRLLP